MASGQLGIVSLAVIIGGLVAAAQAADLTLTNPSFESDSVADGTTSPSHRGWTQYGTTGSVVTWNPTPTSFLGTGGSLPSPATGTQCLWLTGEPDLYQVYSYFCYIEADKVYTLTAAIGAPLDRNFGDFAVVLASPDGEIASKSGGANCGNTDIANRSGLFYDESTSFSTGKGGRTDLVGRMLIVSLSGNQAAIDNVRFTVAPLSQPSGTMPRTTVETMPQIMTPIAATLVGLLACVWWIWNRTR